MIYLAGAQRVYGTCAGLMFLAFALMQGVRDRYQPSQQEKTTLKSILAGVHFVCTKRLLLGAISLDLFAVLLGGATALLPIYARDILHTGPRQPNVSNELLCQIQAVPRHQRDNCLARYQSRSRAAP